MNRATHTLISLKHMRTIRSKWIIIFVQILYTLGRSNRYSNSSKPWDKKLKVSVSSEFNIAMFIASLLCALNIYSDSGSTILPYLKFIGFTSRNPRNRYSITKLYQREKISDQKFSSISVKLYGTTGENHIEPNWY